MNDERSTRIDLTETPEDYAERLFREAEEMAQRERERVRELRQEHAAATYAGLLGRVRKFVDEQKKKKGE